MQAKSNSRNTANKNNSIRQIKKEKKEKKIKSHCNNCNKKLHASEYKEKDHNKQRYGKNQFGSNAIQPTLLPLCERRRSHSLFDV